MATQRLIGLNIYRAAAIFMMMAAHSIRVQENFLTIASDRSQATLIDHFLLIFIDIEPIISALFLFIAGFAISLATKSLQGAEQKRQWYNSLLKRAGALYAVAVIFFIAEQGFQWPDMFVSAGVLGIIAVSIIMSASLLLYGGKEKGLLAATIICLLVTYFLESERIVVTGLNGGAGGLLPLIVMGFMGTLFGWGYQKFGDNGLFGGLLISAVIAVFCLVTQYPNVVVYQSKFALYSTSYLDQITQSFIGLFSSNPAPGVKTASYWNHSSIYPLRFTAIIILFLILSVKLIKSSTNPVTRLLNGLGSYGLTIYIYHLLVLAVMEVSGLKPATGWQTLLVIVLLMLSGYALIHNRLRVDPDT